MFVTALVWGGIGAARAQSAPSSSSSELVSVPNATFDPLLAAGADPQGDPAFGAVEGIEVPSDLDRDYVLVQRNSPIDNEWLSLLATIDFEPVEIHGDHVLLGHLPDGTGSSLDTLSETPRWWGPYKPQFKPNWNVEPALQGNELTSALDPDGFLVLVGSLHPGEDQLAYEAVIDMILDGTCGDHIVTSDVAAGAHRGRLLVRTAGCAKDAIQALARLEACVAVGVTFPAQPMSNDSTWYTQTAIPPTGVSSPDASTWQFDTIAKLFSHGVNGRGQVIAAYDQGIAAGDCHLTYGPNPEDMTPIMSNDDPMIPASAIAPSPYVRFDHKVLARYLIGPDAPFTQRPHGTATACLATGDSFWGLAAREGRSQDDPADDEDALVPSQEFGILLDHVQDLDGAAPGAQLIEQLQSGSALANTEHVREQAYGTSPQARVHTTSLGYVSFGYDESARRIDYHAWRRRDSVLVGAVGNFGPTTATAISHAALSKNTIAVGATVKGWTTGGVAVDLWDGSSHGPGFRDMLKPEFVAPGAGLSLVDGPVDALSCGVTQVDSGTSYAAPTVAGIAADLRQYFMDGYYPSGSPDPGQALVPTNALIRALLVNSTRNLTGAYTADCATSSGGESGDRPSFGQGWGKLVIDDSLYLAGDPTHTDERSDLLVLTDTPNGLTSISDMRDDRSSLLPDLQPALTHGEVHEFDFHVEAGEPLHVTLAWTDPPGNEASANPTDLTCPRPLTASGGANPLVNDLDLEIVDPLGKVWRTRPGSAGSASYVPEMATDPMRLWSGGYSRLNPGVPVPCPSGCGSTCPGTDDEEDHEQSDPATCDFATRDRSNTIENVFIEAPEAGWYRARVIGYRVLGNALPVTEATPDWFISDGEGVDLIEDTKQGYALVASGKVSTDHAALAFTQAYLRCGDTATVFVRDADAAGGTVRITTSQGDCDFDLVAVGGVYQASFRIADIDDGATACGTTLAPLVIAGDDETITATFLEDAVREVRATSRVSCRNVSLVSVNVLEGCDSTVDDDALNPDEYAILEVTMENATDRPVDELFGRVTSLWNDVEILGNPGVGTLAGPTGTTAVLQVPVLVHLGGPCTVGSEVRRFILDMEGEHGFRDRIYFNVPMNCTPGVGVDSYRPGEVPSMDGAGGVTAMRVSKTGANNANLKFDWYPDAAATHYNIWEGSIAAFSGHFYDHQVAAGVGVCDLAETTSVPNSRIVNTAATFGTGNHYYLINGEAACGSWLNIAGPMGFADVDRDPTTELSEERLPGGIVLDSSCLP